jgi:hypothetical protein
VQKVSRSSPSTSNRASDPPVGNHSPAHDVRTKADRSAPFEAGRFDASGCPRAAQACQPASEPRSGTPVLLRPGVPDEEARLVRLGVLRIRAGLRIAGGKGPARDMVNASAAGRVPPQFEDLRRQTTGVLVALGQGHTADG